MDFVYNLLVALHLLGMAAIVGGWIAVRSGRTVIAPIVWGARAQLVTGLALVGIASAIKDDEHTVNNTKIAVKLVIALGVRRRRRDRCRPWPQGQGHRQPARRRRWRRGRQRARRRALVTSPVIWVGG